MGDLDRIVREVQSMRLQIGQVNLAQLGPDQVLIQVTQRIDRLFRMLQDYQRKVGTPPEIARSVTSNRVIQEEDVLFGDET